MEVSEKKSLKKCRAQGDELRTFLGDLLAALPQFEISV